MRLLILTICGLIVAAGCSSQSGPAAATDSSRAVNRVTTDSSQAVIYVDGEFNKRGKYSWTNGMRLQDAIEAAGGFTEFSNRRVRLWRSDHIVGVYKLGHGYNVRNNPLLRPGDHIINPREL